MGESLSGRVAVVTGAGAGLGRAEAIGLAREGATVIVNDLASALSESDVLDEIAAAGSRGVAVAGDISSSETASEIMRTATEDLGGLNIVVNNAGVVRDTMLFNMTDDDWDLVQRVHLRGHFLLNRNAAAYWRATAKESGGTTYGRLINTSSEAGLLGPPGQANYAAAKAGITALTLSASRALGRSLCNRVTATGFVHCDATRRFLATVPSPLIDWHDMRLKPRFWRSPRSIAHRANRGSCRCRRVRPSPKVG